jgi:hypothetical protein
VTGISHRQLSTNAVNDSMPEESEEQRNALFDGEALGHGGQRDGGEGLAVNHQIALFVEAAAGAAVEHRGGRDAAQVARSVSHNGVDGSLLYVLVDEVTQAAVVVQAGHLEGVVVRAAAHRVELLVDAALGQVVQRAHVQGGHQLVSVACSYTRSNNEQSRGATVADRHARDNRTLQTQSRTRYRT